MGLNIIEGIRVVQLNGETNQKIRNVSWRTLSKNRRWEGKFVKHYFRFIRRIIYFARLKEARWDTIY